MEVEVRLTGIDSVSAVGPDEDPSGYGELVAPQLNGPIHQHFFNFRLDVNVDDGPNSLYRVENQQVRLTHERTRDQSGIYYAKPDGSLIKEVDYHHISPNGCGLSPDGKTLYVSCANSTKVSVLDTSSGKGLETILCALYPNAQGGTERRVVILNGDEMKYVNKGGPGGSYGEVIYRRIK